MFEYPEGLYVDVRIEEYNYTTISFKKNTLQEQKVRENKGAFIRVFDGQRWYYASITDLDNIQAHIDALAKMAVPNPRILEHPIVKAFEVNRDTVIRYGKQSIAGIPVQEKQALLEEFISLMSDPAIVYHTSYYSDERAVKSIYSSKGTKVTFDKQNCGIFLSLDLVCGDNRDRMAVKKGDVFFENLKDTKDYFAAEIEKNIQYTRDAKPVTPGEYPVLLSPLAAGIFTHESFGHKSESDFMVGDEAMMAEWPLEKTVGLELLNIVDDGMYPGAGYTPYDDEGTGAKKTYLIAKGKLTGRLHSAATAAQLAEPLTGNARAMNFTFEPIVRMTTTYIEKGDRPLSGILAEMDRGIFVDTVNHGSGMSTFTMAPARTYLIENGRITQPVKISVITGNVFATLAEVDAVSAEFEMHTFGGGCGKMEQQGLPVGFGGPYTRVRKLNVQ
ncbi:MAG: TldD/PmbA family protein [Bacillota bacterium]|jgi:TldD protein|nr:TldD/PmbA family protein [Bacillota bacterium]HHU30912.1 TldD/PmbA family protein [Bacillota bacterium]